MDIFSREYQARLDIALLRPDERPDDAEIMLTCLQTVITVFRRYSSFHNAFRKGIAHRTPR